MKTYQYILFFILCLLIFLKEETQAQNTLNQNNGNIYEANSFEFPEQYENPGTYQARDYIHIKPDFNYKADSRNPLYLKSNPWIIEEPTEGSEFYGGADGGVVGATEGSFSVSPTGAAIYTIPIKLPPGVAGMTPERALVYNSQAGDGIMGQGWAIAGLSAITRTADTYFYNGIPDPINFSGNPDDQFILDGERMIYLHQNKKDASYEYKTEVDGFSKILFKSNGMYNYFEVHTKSGLIKEYGNSQNSRQILSGCVADDEPFLYHIK